MNKKISIIVVMFALMTLSLLKLKANPITLEDIGFSPTTAAQFLKDTKETVNAIHTLRAYRAYLLAVEDSDDLSQDDLDQCYENQQEASKIVKKLSVSFDDLFFIIKGRAYVFQNSDNNAEADDALKYFGEEYATIVNEAQKNSFYPFLQDVETILDQLQIKWEDKNMDFRPFEEVIQQQKKIVDAYLSKYDTILVDYLSDTPACKSVGPENRKRFQHCHYRLKKEL